MAQDRHRAMPTPQPGPAQRRFDPFDPDFLQASGSALQALGTFMSVVRSITVQQRVSQDAQIAEARQRLSELQEELQKVQEQLAAVTRQPSSGTRL